MVLDSTSGVGRLHKLVPRLQLLYENSRIVPVPAGPSSQVVEDDPRVCELKSKVAMKEIERVAVVVVAASSSQESDVLTVQNVE